MNCLKLFGPIYVFLSIIFLQDLHLFTLFSFFSIFWVNKTIIFSHLILCPRALTCLVHYTFCNVYDVYAREVMSYFRTESVADIDRGQDAVAVCHGLNIKEIM